MNGNIFKCVQECLLKNKNAGVGFVNVGIGIFLFPFFFRIMDIPVYTSHFISEK